MVNTSLGLSGMSSGAGGKIRLVWRNTVKASMLSVSLYGILWAEPSVESRGKAHGGGQGLFAPEAKCFCKIMVISGLKMKPVDIIKTAFFSPTTSFYSNRVLSTNW